MSNEFRPGHPFIFWISILLLIFAFFSGAKAMMTLDACEGVSTSKTWQVWPPEWKCG